MNAHSKIAFSRRPTDRPVAAEVRAGLLKNPGFGKVFTDHMVTIRWTQDRGDRVGEIQCRFCIDHCAGGHHAGTNPDFCPTARWDKASGRERGIGTIEVASPPRAGDPFSGDQYCTRSNDSIAANYTDAYILKKSFRMWTSRIVISTSSSGQVPVEHHANDLLCSCHF
jgi:hypothetical protein